MDYACLLFDFTNEIFYSIHNSTKPTVISIDDITI